MNKSTLWIAIFVKLHLNTWFSLSLKLTFSSQNHYQKFSRRTASLRPCSWLARRARKERKLLARRENLLVPNDRTGVFSSPVLATYVNSKIIRSLELFAYSGMKTRLWTETDLQAKCKFVKCKAVVVTRLYLRLRHPNGKCWTCFPAKFLVLR